MKLKFGLATPSTLWNMDIQARRDTLSQIVDRGFDHLFMADHVSFRDGSGTDGFVEVAALSQLHPTIGVMISIYLLPLRHPLPVARQLATMARIAPGRMTFGVGIGGEDRHEIEICGVNPATRGALTNESLAIIRGLMNGEELTFHGKHFTIEQARIRPMPSQAIPIIVGGRSNAALRRAATYADGWIGVWCSAKRYAEATGLIDEYALAANRTAPQWLHGYQPWIGVDADPVKAKAVVKQAMEKFYHVPFEQFERYTPFGTPAQVAEQLAPYVDSGCRLFNLKVCTQAPEEEVDLGGEVLSALSKMHQDQTSDEHSRA
ncbi:MAG: LLM class flavin-dependent oxidoreductase [SAR86 cluster bacterium]|uniref:LLM class flavin-dependent oxidoreductase n=1 Tax=SAR86 cluster bacterium TaxID=2030880 RepID=A0A973A9R4_9GAMM|nr:LLM class flavin-dependent oxidoreductase [SAR86 cluster bacterium]